MHQESSMSGFKGESSHPLDSKGRFSLLLKHRKMLPEDFYIMRSPNKKFPSLWIISDEAHEAWKTRLYEDKGNVKENSESSAQIRRDINRGLMDVSVDSVGRILIPPTLRQYASLDKTVTVIGVEDHIEIWNDEILAQNDAYYGSMDEGKILDLP